VRAHAVASHRMALNSASLSSSEVFGAGDRPDQRPGDQTGQLASDPCVGFRFGKPRYSIWDANPYRRRGVGVGRPWAR
jgi:hypothetical protein